MPMTKTTKKRISRALKKYHRCARRAKCSKKPVKRKKKKTVTKKKQTKKPRGLPAGYSGLPPGYNIHTGKLDDLFLDEDVVYNRLMSERTV